MKTLQEVEINGEKWVLKKTSGLIPFCWFVEIENYTAEGREDGLVYRRGFHSLDKAESWFKGEVLRA